MKKKKNILLLIAGILGVLYVIYITGHFGGGLTTSSTDAELVGAGLATAIVMPHITCTIGAVIFNIIAYFSNKKWAALVAAILYAVAIVLFFLYGIFVVIQMILCFVAFAQMKNKEIESNKQ